jgi:acyl dehydratase
VIPRTDQRALGNELLLPQENPRRAPRPLWRRLGDSDPLHFDPDFAEAQEIGDTVVPDRLKCIALGKLVSDSLGHCGFIRRISAP